MKLEIMPMVGLLFIAIAILFMILSIVQYAKTGSERAIARKVRLRLAFIFALVGIGLNLLHKFLR